MLTTGKAWWSHYLIMYPRSIIAWNTSWTPFNLSTQPLEYTEDDTMTTTRIRIQTAYCQKIERIDRLQPRTKKFCRNWPFNWTLWLICLVVVTLECLSCIASSCEMLHCRTQSMKFCLIRRRCQIVGHVKSCVKEWHEPMLDVYVWWSGVTPTQCDC